MSTTPTVINLNDTTPVSPNGEAMGKFLGDGNNPRNVSVYIPTADATTKGCVQLVGDVQGSGDLIQVSGVQGLPISNFPDTNGMVPIYDASAADPASGVYGVIRWGSVSLPTINVHDESLTDGNSNFIFAGGDIVTVVGVPN
jgi:hypothetical protein